MLLPLVDLVEEAYLVVAELVEVVGRTTIEVVLVLSAEGVAGPKHRGKATGEIRWHGRQAGRVCMSNCKVRVVSKAIWPRRRLTGKNEASEPRFPGRSGRMRACTHQSWSCRHHESTRAPSLCWRYGSVHAITHPTPLSPPLARLSACCYDLA